MQQCIAAYYLNVAITAPTSPAAVRKRDVTLGFSSSTQHIWLYYVCIYKRPRMQCVMQNNDEDATHRSVAAAAIPLHLPPCILKARAAATVDS